MIEYVHFCFMHKLLNYVWIYSILSKWVGVGRAIVLTNIDIRESHDLARLYISHGVNEFFLMLAL